MTEIWFKCDPAELDALPYIGVAKEWALRHTEHRLEAEVKYLADLVAAVPAVIADERHPRPRQEKPLGKSPGT